MLVGGGGKGGAGGRASSGRVIWLLNGVGGARFGGEAASPSVWPSSVWLLGAGGKIPSCGLRFRFPSMFKSRAGLCDEAEWLVAGAEGGESPVR